MPDYARMLQTLEDGSFAPARFNHRDHIGLGYQAIATHGPTKGAQIFAQGLEAAAERLGLVDKYHATITMAFLSLIAERVAAGPSENAERFIKENPDLLEAGILGRFYSPARLSSALAKRVFLMPDRVA